MKEVRSPRACMFFIQYIGQVGYVQRIKDNMQLLVSYANERLVTNRHVVTKVCAAYCRMGINCKCLIIANCDFFTNNYL